MSKGMPRSSHVNRSPAAPAPGVSALPAKGPAAAAAAVGLEALVASAEGGTRAGISTSQAQCQVAQVADTWQLERC